MPDTSRRLNDLTDTLSSSHCNEDVAESIAAAYELLDIATQLLSERNYWRQAAVWMADVHAANRHIADLKKTSASERRRLVTVMKLCVSLLGGDRSVFGIHPTLEEVRERLQTNVQDIEQG